MIPPRCYDRIFYFLQHLTRIPAGCVGAILECIYPSRLVPVQPFIAGFAANFEAPTDLGHAPFLALAFLYELQSLIHHRTLLPTHTSLFGDRRKIVNTIWGMFCYQSHRSTCYHSRRSVPPTRHARVRAPRDAATSLLPGLPGA